MGDEVGTPEEQRAKMECVFEQHLRASHCDKIASPASAQAEAIRIRIRNR
jgi:hypothetical protein